MDNLVKYENYEQYKDAVKKVLNRTVEDFVLTGYLLKQGRDTDILKNSGYANINEFAAAEYNLDASQVSRYIKINDKFSEGGYSDHLQQQYVGYGYAKLAIMLTMPESITEELSPALSKSEIQAVKEEVESEQAVSDIEVILEGENEEQKELGNLEKALHQLFYDEPKLFAELYEKTEPQYMQEILAPSGEKIYSVRIQGVGRIMMFLREGDKVTVHKIRENEKEYYTWDDIFRYLKTMVTDAEAKERWKEIYNQEFPKEEIAPVQPVSAKQKPRKESKVKKAKKSEAETGTQKPKTAEILNTAPISEEENQAENTVEIPTEPEEIPGQMELTRDMPEYCPENKQGKTEEKPENTEGAGIQQMDQSMEESDGQQASEDVETDTGQLVKSPFGSRKQYLDSLPNYKMALYMAAAMQTLPHMRLNFVDFWEKWLSAEVDENGEEIEVVE